MLLSWDGDDLKRAILETAGLDIGPSHLLLFVEAAPTAEGDSSPPPVPARLEEAAPLHGTALALEGARVLVRRARPTAAAAAAGSGGLLGSARSLVARARNELANPQSRLRGEVLPSASAAEASAGASVLSLLQGAKQQPQRPTPPPLLVQPPFPQQQQQQQQRQ